MDQRQRERAKQMIEQYDDVLQAAIAEVVSMAVQTLLASNPDDTQTRENCYMTARAAETIYGTLKAALTPDDPLNSPDNGTFRS